jgi:hypothetical protein
LMKSLVWAAIVHANLGMISSIATILSLLFFAFTGVLQVRKLYMLTKHRKAIQRTL